MEALLEKYKTFLGVSYRKRNSQLRYYDAAKKFTDHATAITQEEIQRYLIHLNQTQKPKSIRANIVGLNRFLKYLGLQELKAHVPRDRQITRHTIHKEQIIQLLRYVKEKKGYQDYMMVLMIRDLKCRNHEIIKTRWDWIYDGKIHFHDCKTGDTTGPISQELHEAFEYWRQHTPYPDSPYVFNILKGQYKGHPMSNNGDYVRHLINHASIKTVGRKISPQDLRASIISAEFKSNIDPRVIQMTARHKNLDTTLIYNHASEEDAVKYIETGTIFQDNNPGLLPKENNQKRELCLNKPNKPYGIYNFTPDSVNGEDDTNTVSFSFSLFNDILSGAMGQIFACINLSSLTDTHAPGLVQNTDDCDWINDAGLGWSELEPCSALVQPQQFRNNNRDKYLIFKTQELKQYGKMD